jgi:hypothetical protein
MFTVAVGYGITHLEKKEKKDREVKQLYREIVVRGGHLLF